MNKQVTIEANAPTAPNTLKGLTCVLFFVKSAGRVDIFCAERGLIETAAVVRVRRTIGQTSLSLRK